jgi:MazG family protein
MVRYLTEEVFELADALESDNPADICDELGDVLFQILFIAHIYQDLGLFDIATVARRNRQKMIRRHPHVFGDDSLKDADSVRQRWHDIKRLEKKEKPQQSLLDSVPRNLPAMLRAYRISERAAFSGFDWPNMAGVIDKVKEEWQELLGVLGSDNTTQTDEEFGDLLFTLVNLARFARIHPEASLASAAFKFETRFRKLEKKVADSGRSLKELSIQEMDQLWEDIKANEPQS